MRNNCGYLVTVMSGALSSIPAFGEDEISMVLAAFMSRLKSILNDEEAKTALIDASIDFKEISASDWQREQLRKRTGSRTVSSTKR